MVFSVEEKCLQRPPLRVSPLALTLAVFAALIGLAGTAQASNIQIATYNVPTDVIYKAAPAALDSVRQVTGSESQPTVIRPIEVGGLEKATGDKTGLELIVNSGNDGSNGAGAQLIESITGPLSSVSSNNNSGVASAAPVGATGDHPAIVAVSISTPEPTGIVLLGVAGGGLLIRRRR